MSIETEVKIPVQDADDFKRRLHSLDHSLLTARHFEDNYVFDFPDGRLRAQSCMLRVRRTNSAESVTFKGPPRPSRTFKKREETETLVESAEAMLQIFEQVGMKVWFRYQKYREEYAVHVASAPEHAVRLSIDVTPIGSYVELEGAEDGIREVAANLGFTEAQFLRDSYYALFLQTCRERGETPGDMVFSPPRRA